ncbi:hypothetical protein [Acanthamoeba polyphaga mimivirus]|uniref:Uncharacterized protein n=2 Tax=Megamimivirinae TaxID=3044648 RepID=A0A2L2DK06_MIMIV|nr:hypothetical protein MegaChil _gp0754 [Megavirus chiliensis]AEQ32633.1 hypothetical protein [Megavirus chiliensis]AVG46476.1 hypothetical protein [Acanthamoeba polyphaga mimivirus]AVG47589.1 hypothetical protein [Acanthamoeba polyphaga mimivirus]
MDSTKQNNIFKNLPITQVTTISQSKICFCIDSSGSTGNIFAAKLSYMDVIKSFIKKISNQLTTSPQYISWDCSATIIDSIDQLESRGGTCPSCIFENEITLQSIKMSDMGIIITDGNIESYEINNFSNHINNQASHFKAVIGVIIGRRTGGNTITKPHEINISVLLPAMISNACILFYNYKKIYVMWTSGIFKNKWKHIDVDLTTSWDDMTTISANEICQIEIPIPDQSLHKQITNEGYIPLGLDLYFNPKYLLMSNPDPNEIIEYPFYQICQYYKTGNNHLKLLQWLKQQKEKFIYDIDSTECINITIENAINNQQSYLISRDKILACRYPYIINTCTNMSCQSLSSISKFFTGMINILVEDLQNFDSNQKYTLYYSSKSRYSNFIDPKPINDNKILCLEDQIINLCNIECSCTCEWCKQDSVPVIVMKNNINKDNMELFVNEYENIIFPYFLCPKCAECLIITLKMKDKYNYNALPIIPINQSNRDQYYTWFHNKIICLSFYAKYNKELSELLLIFLTSILKKFFQNEEKQLILQEFSNSIYKKID